MIDKNNDWQITRRGYNIYEVLSAFQKAAERGFDFCSGLRPCDFYKAEGPLWLEKRRRLQLFK